jgi:hypothetical protein
MMHVVQVVIDDSSNKTITGIWEFDRTLGGVLIIPSGSSFPVVSQPGEIFWNTANNILYRRDDTNSYWTPVSSSMHGGGDPNAAYALITLTGSLPNARKLTGSAGIDVTDTGPGGQYIFSQNVAYNSASHAAIRQLIHLADGGGGPYETFGTTYCDTGPQPFPTSSIWYADVGRTKKITEQIVSYNANKTFSTVQWKVYAPDGITLLATATDTITYSGIFETSRTRVIT